MTKRLTTEQRLLAPFIAELTRRAEPYSTGRKRDNQISLGGQVFFQRSDLWVPRARIAVEVESAGGVTNLGKFWYLLEQGMIESPLTVLHVFSQVSDNDWEAHFRIWDVLAREMRRAFGDKFVAHRFGCRLGALRATAAPALAAFSTALDRA